MKKRLRLIAILFFGALGMAENSQAAGDMYVSTTGTDNSTCGAIGSPCRHIQYAITNRITDTNGGWHIILRGGTYNECNIYIPASKTGTSSNWSSMSSYPGEWAIIDGQRNCVGSNIAAVIRNGAFFHTGNDVFAAYWLFERLEITGGGIAGAATTAAGIWWNKGPVTVRYCYIHDNLAANQSENPAGFNGCNQQYATIEYNYFKNNGSILHEAENSKNILLTASTHYAHAENPALTYEEKNYQRNNIIQYNLVEAGGSGDQGIGMKTVQRLTSVRDGTDMSHSTWGDKIHHNIVTNTRFGGIYWQQDFAQIYNNIVVPSSSAGEEDWGITMAKLYTPSHYQTLHNVIYNNTIIDGHDAAIHNGDRNDADWDGIVGATYWWCLNNLIDNYATSGTYRRRAISLGTMVTPDHPTTNVHIDGNYIYRSNSPQLIAIDDRNWTKSQWETAFPSQSIHYRASENSSDLLYQGTSGANKYRTRGAHVMDGTTTIATGGVGGFHPYLSGVTVPSYVGASNPSDDSWVAGVLALNTAYFTSQVPGSIPSWMEGDKKGDVNNDQKVDLADSILALQVNSGLAPSSAIHPSADVDNDQKIGLVEAVFALQTAGSAQ